MASTLTIWYLFLGGAGGGAVFLLVLLDLISPQGSLVCVAVRPNRALRMVGVSSSVSANTSIDINKHTNIGMGMGTSMGTSVGNGVRRIPRLVLRYQPQTAWRPLFAFGFTTALIALALATCCLIFDLGRIDQAFSLFTHPRPTHLTIGAFALVALLATTGFLALIWGLHFRPVPRPLVRTLQAVALVTAFMVMLYTGLLFQSIGTGLLLGSWLIPVLFVLSSLATGIALLLIAAFLSGTLFGFRSTILRLLRLDLALITTELLAIFALFLLATPTDSVIQTVDALLAGAYALPFWTGFVFCGLALPLTLEAFMQLRQSIAGSLTIFIALSVLVGGYCLRWTLIGAGFPIFAPAVGMGAL